jgi:hypothetical protein
MRARLGAGLNLLELGSSPGDLPHLPELALVHSVAPQLHHRPGRLKLLRNRTLSSSPNAPKMDLAAQRHLLRDAVIALPLPKLRLLSRRQLDQQTHVGHGMRHSKSHKPCLAIYRTLH